MIEAYAIGVVAKLEEGWRYAVLKFCRDTDCVGGYHYFSPANVDSIIVPSAAVIVGMLW